MRLFDPNFTTRRRLKVGLTIAGAVAGAAFGVLLTRLGKLVTGAPPASLGNYAWNAAVFGVVAGVVSPLVSWSALRRACRFGARSLSRWPSPSPVEVRPSLSVRLCCCWYFRLSVSYSAF